MTVQAASLKGTHYTTILTGQTSADNKIKELRQTLLVFELPTDALQPEDNCRSSIPLATDNSGIPINKLKALEREMRTLPMLLRTKGVLIFLRPTNGGFCECTGTSLQNTHSL